MSTATLIPLIAAPRRVDVKAIDRELAELWRAAAASSEAERIALSRARTLTLVAYAPTPDAGARLAEVAARTCQRHPARTIILIADPAAADLTAEVTAVCQVRRRNLKQICCEQVLIRAAPAAEGRIPSLVRQVILPDMPVVLYWPGPPAAERLFRDLGEIVDRVIVDTAAVPDGHGALLAAHTLAADRSSHAALSDLTWGRMTTWRGLTAHFFDPPYTEALDRITRIRVAHAGSSRAQGLLYVGWLAGRMRWRVEQPFIRGDGPWRGTLVDQRGRAIPVSLHAESRAPHPAGALLSTLIVTGSPGGQNGGATFSIARKDDAGSVIAVAESEHGQVIRRALPLDPQDEVPLLAAEMDVLGHDRVYEESLRAVAALLGQA